MSRIAALCLVAAAFLGHFPITAHAGNGVPDREVVVWGMELRPENAGRRAVYAEFERRHPGVKVRYLGMPTGGVSGQKLMTSIVGKTPPDLVNWNFTNIGDWAARGALRPLDDLLEQERSKPDGIHREDMPKTCWDAATYNGHIYGIPYQADAKMLYYNKAIFRARSRELIKAGLDPNRPPRTWEELVRYAKALTEMNPDGSFKTVGFDPTYGRYSEIGIHLYAWQNGGELVDPSGTKITMNDPRVVQALQYMVDARDSLSAGGRLTTFISTLGDFALDPFLLGQIAMKIDGRGAMAAIAQFAPNTEFGLAPPPIPEERLRQTYPNFVMGADGWYRPVDPAEWKTMSPPEKGRFNGQPRYISQAFVGGWVIPKGARHVKLAWEFVKWYGSPEGALLNAQAQDRYDRERGKRAIPESFSSIKGGQLVLKRCPPSSRRLREGMRFHASIMKCARFQMGTCVSSRLNDEQLRAMEAAISHDTTGTKPKAALDAATRTVQKEVDKIIGRQKLPEIPVYLPVVVAVALVLGLAGFVVLRARGVGRGRMGRLGREEATAGLVCALPWIIGFLVFTVGPIATSITFSFCDYDVLHDARWVGLANYRELLSADWPLLSKALWNAGYLSVIGIPLGLLTGLAIALLLNTKVKGMTWYRTVYYLPSIVPTVASAMLWIWVLNPEFGLINSAWRATLTPWLHWPPPGWLSSPDWSKPALVVMGLWGAGGGMILWLAGLQGVSVSLYEAAELDGANAWHKFRAVTVPMLTPYIFFMLIMGTIGALQTFDSVYVMTNPPGGPVDSTLVPVLYLFVNAFAYFKMGYASALAWILFAIILALTLAQLRLAQRWVYYEGENK